MVVVTIADCTPVPWTASRGRSCSKEVRRTGSSEGRPGGSVTAGTASRASIARHATEDERASAPMLLELTPDQEFFRETTARFLDEHAPVAEVRRRRDDPAGFDPDYWRRGADLGWTSLLVGEAAGGGTISGQGLIDLTLVAAEFGRHAAPGPLVPTNVVAAALNETAAHSGVLAELLAGTAVATWCYTEPPASRRLGDVALEMRVEGDEVVL